MSAAVLEQPIHTIAQPHPELRSISLSFAVKIRASSRVNVLTRNLTKAVQGIRPEAPESHVHGIVAQLMSNFLLSGAQPAQAMLRSRGLLETVATDIYRAGWTLEDISAVGAAVHRTLFRLLNQVLGGTLFGKPMQVLRYQATVFMHTVFANLVSKVETEQTRAKQEARREQALIPHAPTLETDDFWVEGEHEVRLIVSVFKEFPQSVLDSSKVLSVRSSFEILVAGDVAWADLEKLVSVQAVAGPVTDRAEFTDGMALTWGAVRLLRTGQVNESRQLIPVQDLAGAVLVAGNSVIVSVLIEKHLSLLDEFALKRRIDLGRALLYWLESRVSYNQVAREMGVRPQTMHGRLTRLQEIFGERLDDPLQRIEIVIALRSALPVWRREAG